MASRVDAAGNTSYSYDSAGRLATLANPTTGIAASYSYDNLSQVSKIVYGSSGNTRWFGYDSLHRLTSDELKTPGGASIAKIAYGWDANGNETSKTTTGFAGSVANTYTYDLANRLTSWDNGITPVLYAYDKSSNRVQSGTTVFTYDERNQLKTAAGASAVTYSYTARGTLSAVSVLGTSTTLTKADAFNQVLSQDSAPATPQTYQYDALGRAIRTGSSYTGTGNLLAADSTATYTRDPGGVLSGAGTRLVWTDLHADVVGQFTPTGATLAGSTTYLGRPRPSRTHQTGMIEWQRCGNERHSVQLNSKALVLAGNVGGTSFLPEQEPLLWTQ